MTLGGAGGGTLQMTAAGQTLTLSGPVTATAGTLTLDMGTSNANLNNTANNFGTVQVTSGGAISLIDANALTLATSSLGTLTARTLTGDLTLAGSITASGSGNAIVLAAGGNFINNAGSSALTPGTGRWLVYSSNPATDTFGGLASGNLALWNQSYAGNPPAGIAQTGNRYLFGTTQTLTFTSGSLTKTYGDNVTASLPGMYTVSGANSNTYGGAIIADSSVALSSLLSGAAAVTSAGAAASANVTGSPYAVTVAAGTLSSLTGYGTAFSSSGAITVSPYAVSLSGTRIYDTTRDVAASIFSFGSLVGSETLGLSGSGTLADKHVGTGKAVNTTGLTLVSGSGLASNYTFTGGTQTVNITPASLTVNGVTASDKVYDATTVATLTGTPTLSGILAGDAVTVSGAVTSGTFANKNVGTGKSVTATLGGLTLGSTDAGNYQIGGVTTPLTANITSASLTITANNASKIFGNSLIFAGTEFTSTGLQGGETISRVTLTSTGAAAAAAIAGYPIMPSNARNGTFAASNYVITYVDGVLTVTESPVTGNPAAVGAIATVATQAVGTTTLVAAPSLTNGLLVLDTLRTPVDVLPNLNSPNMVISSRLSVASCGISLPFTSGAVSCGH
ncbi:MAG: YDG domain-containing protein [Nitrosospira sp.]|nr:YDG domain-containing protein [Nitrosospira sp.]